MRPRPLPKTPVSLANGSEEMLYRGYLITVSEHIDGSLSWWDWSISPRDITLEDTLELGWSACFPESGFAFWGAMRAINHHESLLAWQDNPNGGYKLCRAGYVAHVSPVECTTKWCGYISAIGMSRVIGRNGVWFDTLEQAKADTLDLIYEDVEALAATIPPPPP